MSKPEIKKVVCVLCNRETPANKAHYLAGDPLCPRCDLRIEEQVEGDKAAAIQDWMDGVVTGS